MAANKDSMGNHPASTKKDKLEALLRQEESKLLDLLTAVTRKSGDTFDPSAPTGGRERSKSRVGSVLFASERKGSIRPGISSTQRECAHSKNAISELQTLLDQSILDMNVLREEKDKEIKQMGETMEHMVIHYCNSDLRCDYTVSNLLSLPHPILPYPTLPYPTEPYR
jgi:hypothetical protein